MKMRVNTTLLSVMLPVFPSVSQAQLSYTFSTSGWPDTGRREAAVAAIDSVVKRFNAYGNFNAGNDGNVGVAYSSSVGTVYAGVNGQITMGGTYLADRVMQHELNHWLGSGTTSNWVNMFDSFGAWTGPKVN